jgi:hypothetical protein
MVHTASGCTAIFTIFLHPLHPKEDNKPGYGQLYFFSILLKQRENDLKSNQFMSAWPKKYNGLTRFGGN